MPIKITGGGGQVIKMKRIWFLKILYLIISFCLAGYIAAQDEQSIQSATKQNIQQTTQISADKYFGVGEEFYNAKRYEEALKYYVAAVKIDRNYVLAWKKIGFCYYQLKNHNMAHKAFQKVLSINANDREAKQFVNYYNSLQEREKKAKEPKNMLDPMWRAVILPGWGQYHNHQYIKGMVITGAFVIALGLTIYSVNDEKAKYDKYLNTNENHDVLYKEAQDAYNTALILGIITAAIYAGSIVDAAMNYDCIEAKTADIKIMDNKIFLCKNFRW